MANEQEYQVATSNDYEPCGLHNVMPCLPTLEMIASGDYNEVEVANLRRAVDQRQGWYDALLTSFRAMERERDAAEQEADSLRRSLHAVDEAAVLALRARADEMEQRKDAAYEERNRVVAVVARLALALGYKAGTARTAIEGWSEDWHGCVYIELPCGQSSWHFHDSQAFLFADLPPYDGAYDGHTTELKYERLHALRIPPPSPSTR